MNATPAYDPATARTLVVCHAYNGAAFHGFAKQKDPALRTVQGELEHALGILLRREVSGVCAGRTDAGVHARRQYLSVPLAAGELADTPESKLIISLNALTPDDISIASVRFEGPEFSARFSAVRREYRYHIVTGPVPPLFLREFAWWHRGALDIAAMRSGAACLVGEHDFASFCKAQSAEGKNTVRRVEAIEIFEEDQLGERCITIRVVGNAFLHSMVRTIVGTLVQAGAGNQPPEWVAEALAARNRAAAGETAPACGLTFWDVEY